MTIPQSYLFPGAVQPQYRASSGSNPTVLSYLNAFPNLAFSQHLSGQTNTVQSFVYPGAVQPETYLPPSLLPPIGFGGFSNVVRQSRMITA